MNALASTRNPGAAGKEKSGDQWWLKSNYVSCLNLPPTIELLGPLVNFWDGGGKGERYIQEIKPHIPRGVRDGGLFFVRLLEKVYKVNAIQHIKEKHSLLPGMDRKAKDQQELDVSCLFIGNIDSDDDGDEDSYGVLEQDTPLLLPPSIPPRFDMDESSNEDNSDNNLDDGDNDPGNEGNKEEEEQWSTPMEDKEDGKGKDILYLQEKVQS
jgi:hypothetical protein